MGWFVLAESARRAAGEAAIGPIGLGLVFVVLEVLEELSFPRTTSRITNAAAIASAIPAPMRTLDRRAQPVSRGSLTPRKDRRRFGGRPGSPGHLGTPRGYNPPTRAVSSVGRAPARQAGGHWFEPS